MLTGQRKLGQLIIYGPCQLGLEPVTDKQARGGTGGRIDHLQRVIGVENHGVSTVEAEGDAVALSFALAAHLDGSESGGLDLDVELLCRRDEHMTAVGLTPEDGREQPDHRRAPDRAALMVPGPVASDAHARISATFRIPAVDRRQATLVDQPLQLGKGHSLKIDRRTALGHGVSLGLLRGATQGRSTPMTADRTAIVTGAGKRIGASIAAALLADGWTVLAHVHHEADGVPEGAARVVADLAEADCAERIFAAADNLPPARLLVNNAARFAWDGFGDFSPQEFDAHMAVNARAPALLIDRFAVAHQGGDALIVNLLDSKLSAPNPDFLSYTLSKAALAALTELAARALASRSIRVNGIAPGLMLRSSGQSEENFETMHLDNPLRRGVDAEDAIAALRYLVGASAVTGEVITIDSGQRFLGLARDVQFLGPQ